MLSETDLKTASRVLAKCAAYDPWFPKPEGEQAQATIQAWATTFAGIGVEEIDLLGGVDRWYAYHGASDRVLPADIAKEAKAHRTEVRARLSIEQQQVYDELCGALRMEARLRGSKPPLIPMPRVPLPSGSPDAACLNDEQTAEMHRLKTMKEELNRLELN